MPKELETRTYQAVERSNQTDDAIKLFHQATGIGFYEDLPEDVDWSNHLELTYAQRMRFSMVFDPSAPAHSRHRTQPVHTYGAFPGLLNVGGEQALAAYKITAVTVAPSYRRRGILSKQMTEDLSYAQQAGFPVAVLTASEATIYGRFGFEPATMQTRFKLECKNGLKLRMPVPGNVVQIDPAQFRQEYAQLAKRAFDANFGSVDGAEFDDGYALGRWDNWDTLAKPKQLRFAAYYDEADQLAGFVTYKFGGWEEPRAKLVVHKLVATSEAARFKLFEFLGNHDLVHEIHGQGPMNDPLRYALENIRDYTVRSVDDVLWLRILDVATAFETRGYQREGQVVLEVNDRLGLVSGSYLLAVNGQSAQVRVLDAGQTVQGVARVTLSERELAGLLLGSVQLGQLVQWGRATIAEAEDAEDWKQLFEVPREPFSLHSF